MRRDSTFCAKSVRYNIFTNGAPYVVFSSFLSIVEVGFGKTYNVGILLRLFLIIVVLVLLYKFYMNI